MLKFISTLKSELTKVNLIAELFRVEISMMNGSPTIWQMWLKFWMPFHLSMLNALEHSTWLDVVKVRASASQWIDLGFISQVESYQNSFKKWHS